MLHKLTSTIAFETVLMRLTIQQKQFIYQVARLEYRIYLSLIKLEKVNALIEEEKENIASLKTAITASGIERVADKLIAWKVKAEYKLFKLNLRKNKIDPIQLILNQSKLEQLKQALISLENDISNVEDQKQNFTPAIKENQKDEIIFTFWEKTKQLKEQGPVNQLIKIYLKEALQMVS